MESKIHQRGVVIAIDGPSASGKGTVSKILAAELNLAHLDTGAIYRTLAYYILQRHIALDDIVAITQLASTIDFMAAGDLELTTELIGNTASMIAANPAIRRLLDDVQRGFPMGKKGAVIDGRDIGTVIFPDAEWKFFITANVETRARRRFKQLQMVQKEVIFEQILKDLMERDYRDKNRESSPTLPAADAMIIDTSDLEVRQVVDLILQYIRFEY